MTVNATAFHPGNSRVDERPKPFRGSVIRAAVVLFVSCLLLFAGMNLHPNLYDEAIILTGSMRVIAGQVPHQDFYTNYGPGQFYLIASLFKIFGQSVLAERLYDLFLKALIASFVYLIASRYFRKSVANYTTVAIVLLFFALNNTAGVPPSFRYRPQSCGVRSHSSSLFRALYL